MKHFLLFLGVIAFLFSTAGLATATQYGGVEFPSGAVSFADAWTSWIPGPNTDTPHDNPANALGIPNYLNDSNYVSLGWGGSIVVKFTDNSLTTSGNNAKDLWIFEIGAAVEPTDVAISKNGVDWISVGYVGGATAGVDLDAFIGSGVVAWEKYSYVKLTDRNQQLSGYPYAGADIDAVGAISSAAPVATPEPATLLLLGLGIVGAAGVRRFKK